MPRKTMQPKKKDKVYTSGRKIRVTADFSVERMRVRRP
jgi:hypothetical protein